MKRIIAVCLLAFAPLFLPAIEISVGGTRFSIPAPSGFAPLTADMNPSADIALRFVPPNSDQFVLFLPESEIAAASSGGIPTFERRFVVQTAKEFSQSSLSTADFAELKRLVKTKNEEAIRRAEAQLPNLLQKVNKGISNDYKQNLNLSVSQVRAFPPHYETDLALAYSVSSIATGNDKNGAQSVDNGVFTTTFVLLNGKLLYLFVYAEETGLDWTRAESKKWVDMIIAANPSVGPVANR